MGFLSALKHPLCGPLVVHNVPLTITLPSCPFHHYQCAEKSSQFPLAPGSIAFANCS